MAYVCDVGSGCHVYLDNQGLQTIVTVVNASMGQQQQTSNSFSTGAWRELPGVFGDRGHVWIVIKAERGESCIQVAISGRSINTNSTNSVPNFNQEQRLPLKPIENMPDSAPSMRPMRPMRMGNMSMNMNPMSMQMGNMSMQMDSLGADSFEDDDISSSSASATNISTSSQASSQTNRQAINQSINQATSQSSSNQVGDRNDTDPQTIDSQTKKQQANKQKFCSQCGSTVYPDDRFCANCGHQLRRSS